MTYDAIFVEKRPQVSDLAGSLAIVLRVSNNVRSWRPTTVSKAAMAATFQRRVVQ